MDNRYFEFVLITFELELDLFTYNSLKGTSSIHEHSRKIRYSIPLQLGSYYNEAIVREKLGIGTKSKIVSHTEINKEEFHKLTREYY